jgi:hypothetical protein
MRSTFLRFWSILLFCAAAYLFGIPVKRWAQTPARCVDTMGFSPCAASEEVACKNPEQTLTWEPAKPTGFVYKCTCFRSGK